MRAATDPQTLPALLDAVAARRPAGEAFVSPRRRATYAELHDDSVAIGRGLGSGKVDKALLRSEAARLVGGRLR